MLGTLRSKIEELDELDTLHDLFDDTPGYDDETGIQFSKGLTREERRQATMLYRWFTPPGEATGLWGVCLVVGDPGAGKDLFGNWLSHKVKRFFPRKRILRDERPRRLFGEYAGLFNDKVLADDLDQMRAFAKGAGATGLDRALDTAADRWVTGTGEVLLKNSLLYLTEYWRYCYNREPHSAMNKTMGAVHRVKRHLDCLIVGTGQLASELDKKTCLPWIDWKVTCTKSMANPTGFVYYVNRVKYDRRRDVLLVLPGRPFVIAFDAARPRPELGEGRITVVKPQYRPYTEEERVVLSALHAGIDEYDELVEVIEDAGDMLENEVLTTLKELKLNPRKRVVDYPCFFGLYNSKSAQDIKTNLKVSE
ncbi:MAG: hypothetical protein KKD77_21700 [Gammaproteobacteria bacterium]|nr:hypothetical protein [Gammaproteobacteria bacterium]